MGFGKTCWGVGYKNLSLLGVASESVQRKRLKFWKGGVFPLTQHKLPEDANYQARNRPALKT